MIVCEFALAFPSKCMDSAILPRKLHFIVPIAKGYLKSTSYAIYLQLYLLYHTRKSSV